MPMVIHGKSPLTCLFLTWPPPTSMNGRFLLESTKNILAPSDLMDCEEALNSGAMMATEVFISLRSKSILHLFASIGRSLGLKVYEWCSTTLRIPKFILLGSNLLLMGFPQCGSSYYLLMQLDKDFKPLFNLLESQSEPHERSNSIGEASHVFRLNKIDINLMHILEDESNLNLLDWEKLQSLPNMVNSNTISNSLLSDLGMDTTFQIPGSTQLNFSSIVDEVFEFESIKSGSSFPI